MHVSRAVGVEFRFSKDVIEEARSSFRDRVMILREK